MKKGKLGIRYDDSDGETLVIKILQPGSFYAPRRLLPVIDELPGLSMQSCSERLQKKESPSYHI